MSRHHVFSRWVPIIVLSTLLSMLLLIYLRYQRRPIITGISNLSASIGEEFELTGYFFGDQNESSRILFGSRTLNAPSIIEWQENRIKARVPRRVGTVLVKVKTGSGISNGVVLGDAKRFPRVEYGSWLPGAPFVEYIHPPSGSAGTLVSLFGNDFGNRQGNGRIWMNFKDYSNLFENKEPNLHHYKEVAEINLWSDSELRFWVPENISSGNVYVVKGGRFSNPTYFEKDSLSGSWVLGNPVRWSLRQKISISKPGAFPGNSLYIKLPRPVEGMGQTAAVVLEVFGSKAITWENFLDIYRLDELVTNEIRFVDRQIVVGTKSIGVKGRPDSTDSWDPARPSISSALRTDLWVKPNLVSRTAGRITGRMAGDWEGARAIYTHVVDSLELEEYDTKRTLREYVTDGKANSFGYSLYFCSLARAVDIPSRPVGGIYVTDDIKPKYWWWAEFWQEGLGWVPVDPALGDSGTDSFAKLDENHIAFSRGIHPTVPLQPQTEKRIPQMNYSLQDIYEEISGNLFSYKSEWFIPEVLSRYLQ